MLASPESYRHVLTVWKLEQVAMEQAEALLTRNGYKVFRPGMPWSSSAAAFCSSGVSQVDTCNGLPIR